ncbi:hypothetical protein B0H19DRAFT_1384286, partial [Mycena capillaripes]
MCLRRLLRSPAKQAGHKKCTLLLTIHVSSTFSFVSRSFQQMSSFCVSFLPGISDKCLCARVVSARIQKITKEFWSLMSSLPAR